MRKLEKIYDEILKRRSIEVDVELSNYNDLDQHQIGLSAEGTYNILNEYVKDPVFTPVPKEFLNKICSKVKFRSDNVVELSFKSLYEMLREYDYEYFEEFKTNLKKRSLYDGSLYVVSFFNVDDNEIILFNKTFNFIDSFVKDSDISSMMFNEIMKNKSADAFCSVSNEDNLNDSFFDGNAMIFLSLFSEFPKDSLEHELTHFVQRIVGFDKSLSKKFSSSDFNSFMMKDPEKTKRLYEFICSLSDDPNSIKMLINFFSMKFTAREFDQSVKAVLNGFQRIYEDDRLDFVDERLKFDRHVKERAEAKKDISLRRQWLKDFISIIESQSFKNEYLIPFLKLEHSNDFFRKNRAYFIILLYLGFKIMFNFDIEEKVTKHFDEFKFKDN